MSHFSIRRFWTVRTQAVLLATVVAASLALLAFDAFVTRSSPQREREVQAQLQEASHRMAEEAARLGSPQLQSAESIDDYNRRLGELTTQVLRNFPDIEGGFYVDDQVDRFLGYAFPTHHHPGREPNKSDPPPLEAPYIRLQARESLMSAPGDTRLSVRDVEASRVMIVTEPVGAERPARLATWLMYRLVDPRQLGNQVRRYQASTAMAIGGLILAAALLISLGRTVRTQREQEARLKEDLRRSEHLAALGKLLAGVAHELRNPLAAIRSTVQLWERLPDETRTPQSLHAVVGAVDQLNQTISQLLHFSRADHSDRKPVEIHNLLHETAELLAAQAVEQQVTIDWRLASGEIIVNGSPTGLRQVFVNLLQNALQAMPNGGRVLVSSARQADGKHYVIEFQDSGEGISAESRRHLFEPFFTTRPMGTGLGLALCREIIIQNGGSVEYVASPEPGTTFRVTLPLRSGQK
ncbi:MAG TPA: ATP-binding protein [Pirellulales bacterium]